MIFVANLFIVFSGCGYKYLICPNLRSLPVLAEISRRRNHVNVVSGSPCRAMVSTMHARGSIGSCLGHDTSCFEGDAYLLRDGVPPWRGRDSRP